MRKNVSLAELMGIPASRNAQSGMRLAQLGEILGTSTPELPRNQIGRFRLIRALQQRFGHSFRSLPGVSGIIKEFDNELDDANRIDKLSKVKYGRR